jgi:hypothetical protein
MDGLGHAHTTFSATLERLLALGLLAMALVLVRLTLTLSVESMREFGSVLQTGLACLGQPSGVC